MEGSEGRARTSNIWLQRPAFCQLNYLGTVSTVACAATCTCAQLPPIQATPARRPGTERCRRLSLAGIGQNGQW